MGCSVNGTGVNGSGILTWAATTVSPVTTSVANRRTPRSRAAVPTTVVSSVPGLRTGRHERTLGANLSVCVLH